MRGSPAKASVVLCVLVVWGVGFGQSGVNDLRTIKRVEDYIDVAVFFTRNVAAPPANRTGYVRDLALGAITYAEGALAASGIWSIVGPRYDAREPHLRLVACEEVSLPTIDQYGQGPLWKDDLASMVDCGCAVHQGDVGQYGNWDQSGFGAVVARQDACRADLVCIVVPGITDETGSVDGLALTRTPLLDNCNAYMFVNQSFWGHTFSHELGHALGCDHVSSAHRAY